MPTAAPLQSNFSTGEISPLFMGRVDEQRYGSSLAKCLNYTPIIQGPVIRRSGSVYVTETKNYGQARLVKFEFSSTQAYTLELGDSYCRFIFGRVPVTYSQQTVTGITNASPCVVTCTGHGYSNGDFVIIYGGMSQLSLNQYQLVNVTTNTFEMIKNGDTLEVDSTAFEVFAGPCTVAKIYEISTPYTFADVQELRFAQSADVMYIFNPNYPPRQLSRLGQTNWTLTQIQFTDGPYLDINTISSTTLTLSNATGTGVTVTASQVNGINGGSGFLATDVGRSIRLKEGSLWGWMVITAVTDTTHVTADLKTNFSAATASNAWRLGLYNDANGYPSCGTFYQDRLCLGGPPEYSERIDASNSGDYLNFAPTDVPDPVTGGNDTVSASDAFNFTLSSDDVQAIRWLSSDQRGMLVGTQTGEWIIGSATADVAFSALSIQAHQCTSYGSQDVEPVKADMAVLFLQRAGRKLRELTYFWDQAGYKAQDLTQLSEHLTYSGITAMAYQREPQSIVWCIKSDGTLAGMNYERDLDALRVGWAPYQLGGRSDSAGSPPLVEGLTVIPSPDGTSDDVWILVNRYINGKNRRYIEYLAPMFDEQDDQRFAFFVDSGYKEDSAASNGPASITAATQANPCVVTFDTTNFSNGDQVIISDCVGMTQLNGNIYTLAGISVHAPGSTAQLSGVDSTQFGVYVGGKGFIRKLTSTVKFLGHLEGETVQVLGDGCVQPTQVVSGGKITLAQPAATIAVGLQYNSDLQTVRYEAGAANGTALGKKRRTHRLGILLHRSMCLKLGMSFDDLSALTFRRVNDPLGHMIPLFSGMLIEHLDADYDYENQICIRQDEPLPSMILALTPQLQTQDRA